MGPRIQAVRGVQRVHRQGFHRTVAVSTERTPPLELEIRRNGGRVPRFKQRSLPRRKGGPTTKATLRRRHVPRYGYGRDGGSTPEHVHGFVRHRFQGRTNKSTYRHGSRKEPGVPFRIVGRTVVRVECRPKLKHVPEYHARQAGTRVRGGIGTVVRDPSLRNPRGHVRRRDVFFDAPSFGNAGGPRYVFHRHVLRRHGREQGVPSSRRQHVPEHLGGVMDHFRVSQPWCHAHHGRRGLEFRHAGTAVDVRRDQPVGTCTDGLGFNERRKRRRGPGHVVNGRFRRQRFGRDQP